jgi:hypothetical protein
MMEESKAVLKKKLKSVTEQHTKVKSINYLCFIKKAAKHIS